MTPALRRAHRTIWVLLAVGLPLSFIAVLIHTEQPLLQEPVDEPLPVALPVVVRSMTTPDLVVTLRRSAQQPGGQLDIVLKRPLEVPSAVVRIRQQGKWQALGLLNTPGTYRFPVRVTDAHPQVTIVDDLHQRTVATIAL